MCHQNPHLQGPTGNISPSEEKPYKVLMPALGSDFERCFYLQGYLMVKKDIEIQPGFEPGSSEYRSDALTNWATGALALEQRIDGIYP